MRHIDNIRTWYFEARKSEQVDVKAVIIWEKVIKIIQIAFEKGEVPRSFCNGVLVLIPKPGNQGIRGIALLETIYKIVSMIIHKRLMSTIEFHEAIQWFPNE